MHKCDYASNGRDGQIEQVPPHTAHRIGTSPFRTPIAQPTLPPGTGDHPIRRDAESAEIHDRLPWWQAKG
jgi:hypothetical protein